MPLPLPARSRAGRSRAPELLLALEVPLRRLDGDVPQEKLNLIQLSAGQMAQAGAGPSEIVRRQSFDESSRVTVS